MTPGHAFLTNLSLSGVSATFTAPSPARGGQEEIVVVADNHGMVDDFSILNTAWLDTEHTSQLPQTGTATYQIDGTSIRVTNLLTGSGILNTEGSRFGDVLAGETGDLTVTANYSLLATPGATSVMGQVDLVVWNITTDELKSMLVELPEASDGTSQVTVHFNMGDVGSITYTARLRSEGAIVAPVLP
jgi:hypothetical protein